MKSPQVSFTSSRMGRNQNLPHQLGALPEERPHPAPAGVDGAEVPTNRGAKKASLRQTTQRTLKKISQTVLDDVRDEREHAAFVARREHFKGNGVRRKNAPKASKSKIARSAAGMLYVEEAAFFKAWRDYTRARRLDTVEMNAISSASDVLAKPSWKRTPREIEALRVYLSSFVSFLATLNLEQQCQLCKLATVVELPDGHVVCETGDPGDAFYIILRGGVSMWHGQAPKENESWDEDARIKKDMGTGDSFGELALQEDGGKRSVTVRTEGPSVLAVLSKRNYMLTVQNVFEQMTRDKVDFLCRVPSLQHEPLPKLRTLALYLTEATHKSGEEICGQYDYPKAMYFILSGEVEVRISMKGRRSVSVSEAAVAEEVRLVTGKQSDWLPALGRESSSLLTAAKNMKLANAGKNAVAAEQKLMTLGVLEVGSEIGGAALATKRRHKYTAVASTHCTSLVLSYTNFALRLSEKTRQLMVSLMPKMPSLESINSMLEQEERWCSRRAGIVDDELFVAEQSRKPSESFVMPERSVLGKPGFGPGAMAGEGKSPCNNRARRRGGLLPTLVEEGSSSPQQARAGGMVTASAKNTKEKVQPLTIASSSSAMVDAAISSVSWNVDADENKMTGTTPGTSLMRQGASSRQSVARLSRAGVEKIKMPPSTSMPSPKLAQRFSSSSSPKAVEMVAMREEEPSIQRYRGGESRLEDTYIDFLDNVPFLSVLLEDETHGNLLAMETIDDLFQAWAEDCKQRKIRFVRYTHNRCVVFDSRIPAAPSTEEKQDAAAELVQMALAMREDVADFAKNGKLARVQIKMSIDSGLEPTSSSPAHEQERRRSSYIDGEDDDGKSHSGKSHTTTSSAASLRAAGASITGTRAAMWAGIGFGTLFVTYAAMGTFVVSFYGSAVSSAEVMLREAYADTGGPPGGPQHESIDNSSVAGQIRVDARVADVLPPIVLLEEALPRSPSPLWEEGRESPQEEPKATVRPSPHVEAMERRINRVQDRGAKWLEADGQSTTDEPDPRASLTESTFVVLSMRKAYKNPFRKRGWDLVRMMVGLLASLSRLRTDLKEQQRQERRSKLSFASAAKIKLRFADRKLDSGDVLVAEAVLIEAQQNESEARSSLFASHATRKREDRKKTSSARIKKAGIGGPVLPAMRPRNGRGELTPCNSAGPFASDRRGDRPPSPGRRRVNTSSNVSDNPRGAGALKSASSRFSGRVGAHARVMRPRPVRGAAAERYLPQILKRAPLGDFDIEASRETISARFR